MKKKMLIALAKLIKHYEDFASSYNSGASDALRAFLEFYGYIASYQGSKIVIHDWHGYEVVRV